MKGKKLRSRKPHEVTALGIGRTFQNIRLFGTMSALDNVRVGIHVHLKSHWWDAIAAHARDAPRGAGVDRRGHALLELVGLEHGSETWARNLPYGDQRRLEIARALGDATEAAPARRADGRHERQRDAPDDRFHPQAPRRARADGPAHRARHAGRHGHQRPDHGARSRRGHRRGQPGRGPGEPQGHRGLPGPRRGRRPDRWHCSSSTTSTPTTARSTPCAASRSTVDEGEIVTLIGSNGAGKSTTLRTISGQLHAAPGRRSGSRGKRIDQRRRPRDRRAGRLPVARGPALFSRMSVHENLEMGAFSRKRQGAPSAPTSSASTGCSRGSRSARARRPARCPAASSRCSRSAGR